MRNNERKVFRLTNAKEEEIPFYQLKESDIFRMEEPTGSPVTFKGKEIFIALGNPYYNHQCTLTIHMKDYEPDALH